MTYYINWNDSLHHQTKKQVLYTEKVAESIAYDQMYPPKNSWKEASRYNTRCKMVSSTLFRIYQHCFRIMIVIIRNILACRTSRAWKGAINWHCCLWAGTTKALKRWYCKVSGGLRRPFAEPKSFYDELWDCASLVNQVRLWFSLRVHATAEPGKHASIGVVLNCIVQVKPKYASNVALQPTIRAKNRSKNYES